MDSKPGYGLDIAELILLGLAVVTLGVTIAGGQWLWLAIALILCLGMSWFNRIKDRQQIRRQLRALRQQQSRLAAELGTMPSGELQSSNSLPTPQQWQALQQTVQTLDRALNQLRQSVNPEVLESRLQQVETLYQHLPYSAPAVTPPAVEPRSEARAAISLTQWQPQLTLAGHSNRVSALALNADGSKLLSGSWDQTLKLWQFPKGKLLNEFEAHAQGIQAVIWGSDRNFASGGYDQNIKLWTWHESDSDKAIFELQAVLTDHSGSIADLAIAADGQWLFSGSYDQTLKRWQMADKKLLDSRFDESGAIAALALAPNQSWIASAGGDGRVSLWQVSKGDRLAVLTGNITSVAALAINPTGEILAAGCTDGTIKLWSIGEHGAVSSLPMQTLAAHTGSVTCLGFNALDRTLISTGVDGLIQIWHPSTAEAIATLTLPSDDPMRRCGIFSLLITADGRWLVVGSNDGSIQIWENSGH